MEDGSPDPSKPARLADTKLMYYVGLIDTEQVAKFQKMVFRITRGKVLVRSRDIGSIPSVFEHMGDKYKSLNPDDNQKGKSKSLLFMFFIGRDSILGRKLKVITTIFDVYNVSLPGSTQEVNAMIVDTQKSRDEMSKVVRKSVDEIHTILEYFVYMQDSGVSRIDELYYLIQREKKICQVMSMLEPHNELYSIKIWIDKDKKNAFINDLNHFCEQSSNMVRPIINTIKVDEKKTKPPTKFDLNEFTEPFQNIVETYAIPKYKEINPATFTCATFPFLFGVMFGDACHGLIMFIFGLYLLFKGKDWKARGGTFKTLASLRYLVAFLGFFSFYCGFLYNDFGSIPLITFESCYEMKDEHTKQEHFERKENCVYPVGVDWVWYMATNEIPYQNSMKMKMSIIFGVLQMLFGIILKGFNAIYFRNAVDFFFEFIPQFLFLGGIFGYMCVLIVIKWLTNWDGRTPPQIINVFTSLNKVEEKNVILGDKDLQQSIQTIILCKLWLIQGHV